MVYGESEEEIVGLEENVEEEVVVWFRSDKAFAPHSWIIDVKSFRRSSLKWRNNSLQGALYNWELVAQSGSFINQGVWT